MIDLSNNNATGHDFEQAYVKGGQRHVYLKCCQGCHFTDRTYPAMRKAALAAKLRVGAYDFLEPLEATPGEAAGYLLALIPSPLVPGRDLRPALDCEFGKPSPQVGAWIAETATIVTKRAGVKPLVYGSGRWLEDCAFATPPGPLWLAAYGKNDGREYPTGKLPPPWTTLTAHQFTSKGSVVGIRGLCDVSHVFSPAGVDVPPRRDRGGSAGPDGTRGAATSGAVRRRAPPGRPRRRGSRAARASA